MNPEVLLAHFNRISEAPDAVPRLRRFILELAVRGKLVQQDSTDEPASELLNAIQAEKVRLLREGEIKKLEAFEPVTANDIPFPIPRSWEAIRMGCLARKLGAGSTPLGGKTVYQKEGVPFLRSQNIYDRGLRLDDVALISRAMHDKMSGTHIRQNDILLNITGASIGRCSLVPATFTEGNVSQHVAIIRLFFPAIREFIHMSLISPFFQKVIDDVQVGVSREGLSMQRLRLFPMLLPPLAEQHRIVTRVNELMGLCDRLERGFKEQEDRRDRLAGASFYRLKNGANAEDFRNYARFHLNHLSRLVTRTEHISEFRRTIINLAVRGKIVPQDSNDVPVSELLGRIRAEKADLIGAAAQEREDKESRLSAEDIPFDLPSSWRWEPLQSVIVFGPQNGISPKPSLRPDAPRAVTLTATTKGTFDSRYFKRVDAAIPQESEFWLRPGDLLFQRGNTREYVGMAAYYSGEPGLFLYPDLMIKVRLSEKVNLRYIHLCALAPHARTYFSTHASGAQATMPKINQGVLVKLPIPLAPFTEQIRIVAKVDELMILCDQLEAQLTSTQSEKQSLLEAVLFHALNDSHRETDKNFAVQA
jgi:type I restriction enzyme S subunit